MWYALALLLALHGLIHLMGFAKAFGAASLPLTRPIEKPLGVAWLVAALLMLAGAVLVLVRSTAWWLPVVPALLLSQALILSAFADAKFGTLANLLIAVVVIFSLVGGHQPPPQSARAAQGSPTSALEKRSIECRFGFDYRTRASS